MTVKVKLSDIQRKAGTIPDFAFFIRDNVHDPKARPACPHAGKYITYMKGNLSEKFFSKSGISFLSRDELTPQIIISSSRKVISVSEIKSENEMQTEAL